jgi:diguanylate cyclase (GGDEF)-like protein
METAPQGIEKQESLSPLQQFLTQRNLDSSAPISADIAQAIESGEITTEDGLAIYKEYSAQLEQESTTDHLTGLLNRRGYEKRMTTAFESLNAPENNRSVATAAVLVLRIDVNGLHEINKYGHDAGDAAIARAAETIQINTRADVDIVARVGGDEFAVAIVLQDTDLEADRAEVIQTIISRFTENLGQSIAPIMAEKDGQEISVPVSTTVGYYVAEKGKPINWQEADQAADADATQKKSELNQGRS